jgi:hypothetical protein
MRRLLVLLLAGVAALGLADCGGGGSSKASTTTTAATRPAGSGGAGTGGKGLTAYLKCLAQHGVNVKKAAASKGSGGAGAALKKDPHYAKAQPACKHLLAS